MRIILVTLFITLIFFNSYSQALRINLEEIEKKISILKTNGEVIDFLKNENTNCIKNYDINSKENYTISKKYSDFYFRMCVNFINNDTATQATNFKNCQINYYIAKKIYSINSLQFANSYSYYLSSIFLLSYPKTVEYNFNDLINEYKDVEAILYKNLNDSTKAWGFIGLNALNFSSHYDAVYKRDSAKFYCEKAINYYKKYDSKSFLLVKAIEKNSFYLDKDKAVIFLLKYKDTVKTIYSDTSEVYFTYLTTILSKMLLGSNYNNTELEILNEASNILNSLYKVGSTEFLDFEFLRKIPVYKKYNLVDLEGREMEHVTDILENNKIAIKQKHFFEYCLGWASYYKNIGNTKMFIKYLKIGEERIVQSQNLDKQTFTAKQSIYQNLADFYRYINFDSCVYYHLNILKLEKEISGEHGQFVIHHYSVIGKLYLSQFDYSQAEFYLKKSLLEMEKGYGINSFFYLSDLYTLGKIHYLKFDNIAAFKEMYPLVNYQLNDSNFIPPIGTSVFNSFGKLYENINTDSSDRYYTEVYKRNTMIPFKIYGLNEREQTKSLYDYNTSLQVILNQISKRSSLNNKADLELCSFLFSKNQLFEYQRVYKYLINEGFISKKNALDVTEKKEVYLKSVIHDLAIVDSLQLNYEVFKSAIVQECLLSKRVKFTQNIENTFKSNYPNISNYLSSNDCYVDIKSFYSHNDETGFDMNSINYAFLIITNKSKDKATYYFLKNSTSLDSAIISNNSSTSFITHQLRDLIKLLKPYKNIYINPDGAFHLLNWYTLKDGEGNYLLKDKIIHTIHSTEELDKSKRLINEVKIYKGEIALFGDPMMNESNNSLEISKIRNAFNINKVLPSLPYTKIEIEDIDNLFKVKGFNPSKYLGIDCNKLKLKTLISPSILHIATHGFYINKVDTSNKKQLNIYFNNALLRSGLIFSNKSDNENSSNILTAFEVVDYNLANTDLVVLSACETGNGRVTDGQGLYGLQRAFRIAGAKTILTSLWKVDDRATRIFMKLFYSEILSGKSKVESLRNTQLIMSSNPLYGEVKYWGAFTLIGK